MSLTLRKWACILFSICFGFNLCDTDILSSFLAGTICPWWLFCSFCVSQLCSFLCRWYIVQFCFSPSLIIFVRICSIYTRWRDRHVWSWAFIPFSALFSVCGFMSVSFHASSRLVCVCCSAGHLEGITPFRSCGTIYKSVYLAEWLCLDVATLSSICWQPVRDQITLSPTSFLFFTFWFC